MDLRCRATKVPTILQPFTRKSLTYSLPQEEKAFEIHVMDFIVNYGIGNNTKRKKHPLSWLTELVFFNFTIQKI